MLYPLAVYGESLYNNRNTAKSKFKQDKKDAAMRASIEVGDTVITIGGVVGRVAAINDKDDTFVLETTSDRVKIRFRRSAISSVEKLDMGNTAKDTAKKDAPAKKN